MEIKMNVTFRNHVDVYGKLTVLTGENGCHQLIANINDAALTVHPHNADSSPTMATYARSISLVSAILQPQLSLPII